MCLIIVSDTVKSLSLTLASLFSYFWHIYGSRPWSRLFCNQSYKTPFLQTCCAARGHVTAVPPLQTPLEVVVFVWKQLLQSSCPVLLLTMMAMENFKQFLIVLSAAAVFGIVSIIFVLTWVLHFREGLAWDGGAAEFNWHPVLIVIGFIFLQGIGEEMFLFIDIKKCKHREEVITKSRVSQFSPFQGSWGRGGHSWWICDYLSTVLEYLSY